MPNCECSGCGKSYAVPVENLGKRANCSACKSSFIIRELEPPIELFDSFDEPKNNTARRSSAKWCIVRGLPARPAVEKLANGLVITSNVMFVLSIIAIIGVMFSANKSDWMLLYSWATGFVSLLSVGFSTRITAEVITMLRAIESRLFEMSSNSRASE